jgi:hypothetical protein
MPDQSCNSPCLNGTISRCYPIQSPGADPFHSDVSLVGDLLFEMFANRV